jgi:multiple sugar transport system permease protein
MSLPNLSYPKNQSRKNKFGSFWYIIPAAIVVAGVIGYPIVHAVILSFYDYNPLSSSLKFVGMANYLNIFGDNVFHLAILHSVIWTLGVVFFQLIFGLLGAVILNQSFKGRSVIRGLVLIPWATPSVLAALIWMWILDDNYGVLNHILTQIGLSGLTQAWFSQPNTALPSLILIDLWQGIPFFAVMLLAAMQSISVDLLEAAKLDGANAFRTFWSIKFPIILPTVLITTMLRIIWTASYADLILIITQGGPGYASLTIPADAYFTAYSDLNYGSATAMAVVQAVVLLFIVIWYLRLISKQGILEQ